MVFFNTNYVCSEKKEIYFSNSVLIYRSSKHTIDSVWLPSVPVYMPSPLYILVDWR